MKKSVGKLTREIENQVYEVNFKDRNVCHIPASKHETLKLLRVFVNNECNKYWRTLPAPVATLKRQYLRELIEKLES